MENFMECRWRSKWEPKPPSRWRLVTPSHPAKPTSALSWSFKSKFLLSRRKDLMMIFKMLINSITQANKNLLIILNWYFQKLNLHISGKGKIKCLTDLIWQRDKLRYAAPLKTILPQLSKKRWSNTKLPNLVDLWNSKIRTERQTSSSANIQTILLI